MGTYIPQKLRKNSFELETVSFSKLYTDSHTSLALQVALELNVKTIYVVGYDGYDGLIGENEKALTDENEFLFKAFLQFKPNVQLLAITYSKYKNMEQQSLFALLLN